MKKNIFLLLLCGLAINQIKTKDQMCSSIFWYSPTSNDFLPLVFGAQSPSLMEGTYGTNLTSLGHNLSVNKGDAKRALFYLQGWIWATGAGAAFNQAVVGPYFATWDDAGLYITQPHRAPNGISIVQYRLLALGIVKDYNGSIISSVYNNSYMRLINLIRAIMNVSGFIQIWGKKIVVQYESSGQTNSFTPNTSMSDLYYNHYLPWSSTVSNIPDVSEWGSSTYYDVMTKGINVFYQSFQSSLFKQQINVSLGTMKAPLSGVSGLEATTYFKNNSYYDIYFRINFITPGNIMDVTSNTTLADVMGLQNTYTEIYAQDGSSASGNNYGF